MDAVIRKNDNRKCFNCRKPGHIAKNYCQLRKQFSKVLEGIQQVNLATRVIAIVRKKTIETLPKHFRYIPGATPGQPVLVRDLQLLTIQGITMVTTKEVAKT